MMKLRRLFALTIASALVLGSFVTLGAAVFSRLAYCEEEAAPAPSTLATQAKTRRKYQKSRLTHDESEATADHRRLLLSTGEDKAVDLDFQVHQGVNGIITGNPKVVVPTLVRVGEKHQIVFKPLSVGDTTVSVRDEDGTLKLIFNVRVTGSNLLTIANEIRSLLRDVEGIDVRVVGSKVVMEGEVLVPTDYARVLAVQQDGGYEKMLMNMVTISPLAMQVLAKRIQDDINLFAPNVKTRVVNGHIFLEGTVENLETARRAAQVAALYLPDPRPTDPLSARDKDAKKLEGQESRLIQSFILVNPPPPKKAEKLVRVTVHFVELSKDYNKVFGFKWQPGFTTGSDQVTIGTGANGSASGTGASFSATISSLFPKLQSAQTAGYARVLKTGTFIVRSGQPARLVEQTQFPYITQGAQGTVQTQKEQVGLEVAATPSIVGQSEDIQMELDLSQTDLVSTSANGPPVTALHKVKTYVYIKSNESAAVAAVNSSDVGTDFNKNDPNNGGFSGQTESLFSMMRTKAYRKKKSQFVIFVTPQIVENASEGTDDLRKNFRIKAK